MTMPRRVGEDIEKRNKRHQEWVKNNRDRINLYIPKGTKEKWLSQAENDGKTLCQWIVDKVESRD